MAEAQPEPPGPEPDFTPPPRISIIPPVGKSFVSLDEGVAPNSHEGVVPNSLRHRESFAVEVARPVDLTYPDMPVELRPGEGVYFKPMVKTRRLIPTPKTGVVENYEDYIAMANNVSKLAGGPERLDLKFLKKIWDISEGGNTAARADWAINELISIWEATQLDSFMSQDQAHEICENWRIARRVLMVGWVSGAANRKMSYSISPPLPEGLAMAQRTGVISGRPAGEAPRTTYTVKCSNDSGEAVVEIKFAVCAAAAPSELAYRDFESILFADKAVAMKPEVQGTMMKWSVRPQLPVGLRLDPASGVISGIPTQLVSETTWTVIAKNELGLASTMFTFAVVREPPRNLNYERHDRLVGRRLTEIAERGFCNTKAAYQLALLRPVHMQPRIEGSADLYKVSPAFPTGLSLDLQSGFITGTPTEPAPAATYTVVAENQGGSCRAIIVLSVQVLPAVALSYPQVDDVYHIGEQIDVEPQVTGGADHWTVEPPLPEGLLLDEACGRITGASSTPVEETSYTITAYNEAGGTSAVLTFAIVSSAPKSLAYPDAVPSYRVGEELLLEAKFRNCMAVFSISPALPEGIVLDVSTGRISGAPEASTTTTEYRVTAANDLGQATALVTFETFVGTKVRPSMLVSSADAMQLALAAEIENVVDPAHLPPEPKKDLRIIDWMIWMVHRAALDDPSLTSLSFSGLLMPLPKQEPRIAPKLMQALATNTHIISLNMAETGLDNETAHMLAHALRINTTLQVLNLDGNFLNSDSIQEMAKALRQNAQTALTQWICGQQTTLGGHYGQATEQTVAEMMQSNMTIIKLTIQCSDPHWRTVVSQAVKRNQDERRRQLKRGSRAMLLSSGSHVMKQRTVNAVHIIGVPQSPVNYYFSDITPEMNMARDFTSQRSKFPTNQQFQMFASNLGRPLKYSEIAPLMRNFRQKLFNVFQGCKVKLVDLTQKVYVGTLTAWSEKNDRWSFEVAVDPVATKEDSCGCAGASGTFRFVASRCPTMEVSSRCAEWLGQDDQPGLESSDRSESGCSVFDGSAGDSWGGEINEDKQAEKLIRDLYARKNPTKVQEVEQLLAEHQQSSKVDFYRRVCEKYGEKPVEFPSEAQERRATELLRDLYVRRNPAKLEEVEGLLQQHKGSRTNFYQKVCEKYSETPVDIALELAAAQSKCRKAAEATQDSSHAAAGAKEPPDSAAGGASSKDALGLEISGTAAHAKNSGKRRVTFANRSDSTFEFDVGSTPNSRTSLAP